MTSTEYAADAVVRFWRDAGPTAWFQRDAAFDAKFHARFLDAHHAAARGELDGWIDTADGALALLILLDQFPRNAFRGSAHALATDPLARHFARRAIHAGHDRCIDDALRLFFYMPFEHSETLADQDRALEWIGPLGGQPLDYARVHRDVIAQFGRFPHRNAVLGRDTTRAEQDFLDAGGFAG